MALPLQMFTISNIMELVKCSLDKDSWKRMIAYVDLQKVLQYHSAGIVDIEIDDFLEW